MSRNKQRRERSDQSSRRRIGNQHASMDAGGLIARRRFLHQFAERAAAAGRGTRRSEANPGRHAVPLAAGA